MQIDATRGKNVKVLAKVIGTSLDRGEELGAQGKFALQIVARRGIVSTETTAPRPPEQGGAHPV